jgi:hypothetical protein
MRWGQLYQPTLERESSLVVAASSMQGFCGVCANRTSSIALIVDLLRADVLQHGAKNSFEAD